MSNKKIVAVGSALVDLLLEESEEFLESLGEPKGGMTLTELTQIENFLSKSTKKESVAPGGSACNTIVGFSSLGGNGCFLGICGEDDLGSYYEERIKVSGVNSLIKKVNHSTGRVLSVITPDAERTMFTYLGASDQLSKSHISEEDFQDAAIVHIEGYLLFKEDCIREVISCAKKAGAKVSLDLASFQVVEFCKPLLEELLKDSVDIVLANEDEAKAYSGLPEEETLDLLSGLCEIAIVKKGDKGAMIKRADAKVVVEACRVEAIDTTGAGDLWASGFLYGLISGYSLEKSGKLASLVASEIVSTIGAHLSEETWDKIHQAKSTL